VTSAFPILTPLTPYAGEAELWALYQAADPAIKRPPTVKILRRLLRKFMMIISGKNI
jgi:hypothetical protein